MICLTAENQDELDDEMNVEDELDVDEESLQYKQVHCCKSRLES